MGNPNASLGKQQPGYLLHRRYRLIGHIGGGGFGEVYKAEDTQVGNRIVAIKEMSQDGLSSSSIAEATEQFREEAFMLAKLHHPNLPGIYDYFSESGQWYLVMEYIKGQTLEDHVSQYTAKRLPVDEVLKIGEQLCTVLEYLHQQRPPIIFRDLKPDNVIVASGGHVYLIDFGIARLFKVGSARDTVAAGSPGYAAPEQYGRAQTTERSDVYSLGAVLNYLLTGVDPAMHPFQFAPVKSSNPQVPPKLDALVMQMVQLDSNLRPGDAATVERELAEIAREMQLGYRVPAPIQQAPIAPAYVQPPVVSAAPQRVVQVQPQVMPFPKVPRGTSPAMKRAVLILSVIALVGILSGFILVAMGAAAVIAHCESVVNDQAALNACIQANISVGEGQEIGGTLLFLLGLLCSVVAWILGLIKTAHIRRWGWFAFVLLAPPLGSLFYGIFGPL